MVICFSILGHKRNGLNIDTVCLDGFFPWGYKAISSSIKWKKQNKEKCVCNVYFLKEREVVRERERPEGLKNL